MPTYEFSCENIECKHYITKILTLEFCRENPDWNKPKCDICGHLMEQTFTEAPGITFVEGHNIESAKPSSYWRQAERDRIANKTKREKIEIEKIRSNDPATVAKQKRLEQNQRNMQ